MSKFWKSYGNLSEPLIQEEEFFEEIELIVLTATDTSDAGKTEKKAYDISEKMLKDFVCNHT